MTKALRLYLDNYVPAINQYLTSLELVDAELEKLAPALPEALHYSLDAGGKRLRPVLTLMAYNLCSDDWSRALPLAAAFELVHTYSLIHDDLPAMDDDDLRRGRPTCHKVYGEALAILVGDALLTEAFRLLSEELQAPPAIAVSLCADLSRAAGINGMVGGQVLDMQSQGGGPVGEELLLNLHRRKTGAMIRSSLLAGFDLAGTGDFRLRAQLDDFAGLIGLAFQVADDILDETGDQDKLGKDIGSDRGLSKLTFVSLYGLDGARSKLRQLHQEARAKLLDLGHRGDGLAAVADYIVERDH